MSLPTKRASPAIAYLPMIPILTEAAQRHGYALAVHGSLNRDLDLIAVPWTLEATNGDELLQELLVTCGWLGGKLKDGDELGQPKPHGRLAYAVIFDNGLFLDLSIMPRKP